MIGKYLKKKYKFIPDHFKPNLPKSIELGDVAGISIDQQDNIYLFNRSKHPVIVLSQTGEFLRTWGQGVFKNPHGSHIGFDNNTHKIKYNYNQKCKCLIGKPA